MNGIDERERGSAEQAQGVGMKKGWQTKKLREVCELVNGRAYSKPELLAAGKYRVLRVGNFFTNDHWYYSDMELEEKKYCDNGDLLYAWSASFGPRIWTGGKAIYHYHIWKVIHDCTQIDQMFLFYFFQWDTEKIKADQGTGTTMMHVSMGSMNERDIQLPPLPEQQRIVALLDEAFAGLATAKANAERNLQNARAIFESQLQSLFTQGGIGWEEKHLGEVCELFQGLCINAKTKDLLVERSSLPLLRIKDLRSNSAEQYIAESGWPKNARVSEDEIIYTRTGQIGLVFRGRTGVLHNNCFKVKPNPVLNSDYFFWWLQGPEFRARITALASKAAQPDITHSLFKVQPIQIPPRDHQDKVIAVIDEMHAETQHLTRLYERKLAALEELKKALLHQAFNGEL